MRKPQKLDKITRKYDPNRDRTEKQEHISINPDYDLVRKYISIKIWERTSCPKDFISVVDVIIDGFPELESHRDNLYLILLYLQWQYFGEHKHIENSITGIRYTDKYLKQKSKKGITEHLAWSGKYLKEDLDTLNKIIELTSGYSNDVSSITVTIKSVSYSLKHPSVIDKVFEQVINCYDSGVAGIHEQLAQNDNKKPSSVFREKLCSTAQKLNSFFIENANLETENQRHIVIGRVFISIGVIEKTDEQTQANRIAKMMKS